MLGAASGQATGLPLVIVALVLAIVTGVVLYRAQRWLTRRTNRVLNVGLCSRRCCSSSAPSGWWPGFLAARSDLDGGIGHGSQPAEELAQASIGVQQIRGDAVLNVISRSGDASFHDDFTTTSGDVGPGPAQPAQRRGRGAGRRRPGRLLVAAAEREATTWYTANATVYSLGADADYARERDLVIGAGAGSSAAEYNVLEPEITTAIGDDDSDFRSAVSRVGRAQPARAGGAGRGAADGARLLRWGLWRRLAEYR